MATVKVMAKAMVAALCLERIGQQGLAKATKAARVSLVEIFVLLRAISRIAFDPQH
ncbi:MAG TPA: hypothetical protein VMM84_01185 [Pyrinomonadaceae bacterium]|nr:hypothetical protein [Pyrinomonadaceae bacterium]